MGIVSTTTALPSVLQPAAGLPFAHLAKLARSNVAAAQTWVHNNRSALIALTPPAATDHPYSRAVLWCDDTCEVLLMHWQHGFASAIHDHGDASGTVFCLAGALVEQTVDLACTHASTALPMTTATRQFQSGESIEVGKTDFHIMTSVGAAVSLHVYTPAPTFMRIADPSSATIFLVGGGHGAWLPIDHSNVIEQHAWPK